MKKDTKLYVHFDAETGYIKGYYNSEWHQIIPEPNLRISKEQWHKATAINANKVVLGELIRLDRKPTKEEIKKNNLIKRGRAYVQESDPLFMEWMFDKSPEKELQWRSKVAEIKERYPL